MTCKVVKPTVLRNAGDEINGPGRATASKKGRLSDLKKIYKGPVA